MTEAEATMKVLDKIAVRRLIIENVWNDDKYPIWDIDGLPYPVAMFEADSAYRDNKGAIQFVIREGFWIDGVCYDGFELLEYLGKWPVIATKLAEPV